MGKLRKSFLIIFILFFFIFFSSLGSLSRASILKDSNIPKINGPDLPNKVYLFQSPQDMLLLEDITLEQYYTYYLYVEIVTPYNCSLKITIWDPEGKQFNIFESPLNVDPESANYFEMPFGTALAGNHDIAFEVFTLENVNLYIKMEKGPKCLYDIIPMEEIGDLELYKVTRFADMTSIDHTILFESDYLYKFYVVRLSPIALTEDNIIRIDLSVEDPDGIIYNIYSNTTLVEINSVDRFKFGTAIGGLYTVKITIHCEVKHVNIGYSIVALNQIGSGPVANQTEPTNSTTAINRYFTMPTEWTMGILVFAGTIAAIIGVVLYKQKRKNVIGSDF